MKIALIGYGKMGRAIEQIALSRHHTIVARIDQDNLHELHSSAFLMADVAIEFTTPTTAVANYLHCFAHHVPVVSGTTGWTSQLLEVQQHCEELGGAFFYASNFSVGVYLFGQLNRHLARLMAPRTEYEVSMEEVHHIHKKDHPSGTALTLAQSLLEELPHKERLLPLLEGDIPLPLSPDTLPIYCYREGEVPGTHRIVYDSPIDTLTIEHRAKGREGFAFGAVLAAEYLQGRIGCYGMADMMSL